MITNNKTITYSKYQLDILDHIKNKKTNLIVEAVAGSGKTTTIIESIMNLPSSKKIMVASFNKSIKNEMEKRLAHLKNVEVRTLHGIGYKTVLSNKDLYEKIGNEKDLMELTKKICYDNDNYDTPAKKNKWALTVKMLKLTTCIKNEYANGNNFDEVKQIVDHNGIDFGWDKKEDVALMKKIYQETPSVVNETALMRAENKTVFEKESVMKCIDKIFTEMHFNYYGFADMVWQPVFQNLTYPEKFDYVFVDEMQDLNQVQHLLLKQLFPESQFIMIGDSFQSIYGFMGALQGGMIKAKKLFNAEELPLSICYRCPELVLEHVRKIVPHIESKENNIQGTFKKIESYNSQEGIHCSETMNPKDLILSRTNKPLLDLLLLLMSADKLAYIEGVDIGKRIIKECNSHFLRDVSGISRKLTGLINEKRQDIKILISEQKFEKVSKISNETDFLEMCVLILSKSRDLTDLQYLCETYFGEDKGDKYIKLSTVHKAKGSEAETVFILTPEQFPHKFAKLDWEIEQEYNIEYVAYTRAKTNLIEIRGFVE
jgi:DNA helicase-2/ATP-dependent DNA helicase PcrA